MPRGLPPVEVAAGLVHHVVPSGSLLWRVTRRDFIRRATLFSERLAPLEADLGAKDKETPFGRFDAAETDRYGYCYVALDDLTAIAETLLRDVRFADRVRAIPIKDVCGRTLAVYETLQPLTLVSLTTSAELARARQDPWLIQADPDEYTQTRRWGHWLRSCAPDAHGFIWPSRRNPGGRSVVLFDDETRDTVGRLSMVPVLRRDMDGGDGLEWLNRRLEDLNTVVDPSGGCVDVGTRSGRSA